MFPAAMGLPRDAPRGTGLAGYEFGRLAAAVGIVGREGGVVFGPFSAGDSRKSEIAAVPQIEVNIGVVFGCTVAVGDGHAVLIRLFIFAVDGPIFKAEVVGYFGGGVYDGVGLAVLFVFRGYLYIFGMYGILVGLPFDGISGSL